MRCGGDRCERDMEVTDVTHGGDRGEVRHGCDRGEVRRGGDRGEVWR